MKSLFFSVRLAVVLFAFTKPLLAAADTYTPLVRCEGGSVVVDRVQADNGKSMHHQLVVQGTEFVEHVGRFLPGTRYLNGRQVIIGGDTFVMNYEVGLNEANPRLTGEIFLHGSELHSSKYYFREGQRYGGTYIFRNCVRAQ